MIDNKYSANRWIALVSCPKCGKESPVNTQKDLVEGKCQGCGQAWMINNHILTWAVSTKKQRNYWNGLKFYLDPLASPFSPFSVLTKFRVERYYERTISDKNLANEWIEHYFKDLKLQEGATILDHGCGRGRNLGLLAQLGFNTLGQDISPNQWWHRLGKSFFQVVPAQFSRLPWKNSSIDFILNIAVIGHLTKNELVNYTDEVWRVLSDGGYWLILEANSMSYATNLFRKHYGRLHPLDSVLKIVKKGGFQELDYSYEGFYAPVFPRLINFLRKQCVPRSFDLSDYNSWLAKKIPSNRRGMWLLRLRKVVKQ